MPEVNLGRLFIETSNRVHESVNDNLRAEYEHLHTLNEQNRAMHRIICDLHAAKKESSVDFSLNENFRQAHSIVFQQHPEIFGHTESFEWKSEQDIDNTLRLLDNQVRAVATEVQQVTSRVSQCHEDKIQYTESAQKTLEMLIRHIESIIAKLRSH